MNDISRILERRIDQALSREKADLVIKGGRILDIAQGDLVVSDIAICGDRIVGTHEEYDGRKEIDARGLVIVPGFIDTHVHIESSCITPWQFDRCVLPRGTTTAICDPHEIANVLGVPGLQYFLDASTNLVMDLKVQLSSCVPASHLETSGAALLAGDLVPLRDHPSVVGLAEFMNFPGVLSKSPLVMDKLAAFYGQHIDGHAPLVSGKELNAYCACGIKNCHESTSLPEAEEKLRKGMQVLMRDGSLCKDVTRLAPLLSEFNAPFIAFCTDDRNPLDIENEGHMDHVIRTAIRAGAPAHAVYRSASWSAAQGFGLRDRGLIAPGYLADLVLLDDLQECAVHSVLQNGRLVDEHIFTGHQPAPDIGRRSIKLDPITPELFRTPAVGPGGPVIGLIPDGVLTEHLTMSLPYKNGERQRDLENDVLKVSVLNRHGGLPHVGRGFIKGFGFKEGAIASSVGHDSHNVIVVGANDGDMAAAVNRLIDTEGGFVIVRDGQVLAELALPIGGLMSDQPAATVAGDLEELRRGAENLGCPLDEPFLHLAFLPLCVIPHLKITDRGLVDVNKFEIITP